MKKIRSLLVRFDAEIQANQLSAFRGAIAKKVGWENELFHNHKSDGGFLYRYPLIQYKRIGGKPAILCLEEGVDDLHLLFQQRDWSISLIGNKMPLKIDELNLRSVVFQVWDQIFNYRLYNWVGLNPKNHEKYKQLKPEERPDFLKRILIGNIISLAKGIQWDVDKQIVLSVDDIVSEHLVQVKGVPLQAFHLNFSCNVSLPPFIGLGKSTSLGFGTTTLRKTPKNQLDENS